MALASDRRAALPHCLRCVSLQGRLSLMAARRHGKLAMAVHFCVSGILNNPPTKPGMMKDSPVQPDSTVQQGKVWSGPSDGRTKERHGPLLANGPWSVFKTHGPWSLRAPWSMVHGR